MTILYNCDGVLLLRSDDKDVANAAIRGVRVDRYVVDVALWNLYNLRVDRTIDGAPYMVDDKRFISISHTQDVVAIMVSNSRCGIDIEHKSRGAIRVARKFTNEDEVEIASEVWDENPHLLIWCAKEALYKLCGVAGAEFKVDFSVVEASEETLSCIAFGNRVNLRFLELDGFLVVHS